MFWQLSLFWACVNPVIPVNATTTMAAVMSANRIVASHCGETT
jgi:hypothetical protein